MQSDPAVPAALLPMLIGRTTFADLWSKGGAFGADPWARAIADVLTKRGFARADIIASLSAHPKLRLAADAAAAVVDAAEKSANASNAVRNAPEMRPPDCPEVRIARWYKQQPALYELDVDGETLTATSAQIATRKALALHCLNVGKVPWLPSQKQFDRWLHEQIAAAEVIEQPIEASEYGAQIEFVEQHLDALPYSEDLDRMSDGCYSVHDGYQYFKPSVFYRVRIQREMQNLSRGEFYRILYKLEWKPHTLRVGEDAHRAWRKLFTGQVPASVADELAEARRKRDAAYRQGTLDEVGEAIDRPFPGLEDYE